MKSKLLGLMALACMLSLNTEAKVRLPHLVGDNMVLQQQTEARLWGWADAGKTVKVTVSWNNDTYTAKADAQGKWMVSVKTPAASFTPLSITFDDGEKTTLNNILSGEVWVCAGQSNMEMPLKGYNDCPVEGYNNVVADAINSKGIRHAKIPSIMRMQPQEDADTEWIECNPNTVPDFSATGYFFARMVSKTLQIPVGIIEANKGGTRVESWFSEENLRKHTDETLDSLANVKKYPMDFHRPMMWGNGTFHPILNYTVKGIVFYQGCSNTDDHREQYAERLAILVKQWREQFGLGETPFYYVQIAPYFQDNKNGVDGVNGALLREQQFKALSLIPNSDMVCTNDAVYPSETHNIHPTQKQKVGERLAFIALNETYGMEAFRCKSPSYKEMKIKDNQVTLSFNDTYSGLTRQYGFEGFEIAGADRVFHKATQTQSQYSWFTGELSITISSDEVKEPVAVRYCFRNFQLGNVANMAGLPLIPFRTDDWDQ